MSSQPGLLHLHAGGRPYLACRDHIDRLSLLDLAAPPVDPDGRPLPLHDLDPLLGQASQVGFSRRHALTVRLHRRSVTLLVERANDLSLPDAIAVRPLAPLLARRLQRPWFLGVATIDDNPVLVLDLRRIAADLAIGVV